MVVHRFVGVNENDRVPFTDIATYKLSTGLNQCADIR